MKTFSTKYRVLLTLTWVISVFFSLFSNKVSSKDFRQMQSIHEYSSSIENSSLHSSISHTSYYHLTTTKDKQILLGEEILEDAEVELKKVSLDQTKLNYLYINLASIRPRSYLSNHGIQNRNQRLNTQQNSNTCSALQVFRL